MLVAPMVTFNVVKERHGWAIRAGGQMTAPYWSRGLAIREADSMAANIRRHGMPTQVLIEEAEFLGTPAL